MEEMNVAMAFGRGGYGAPRSVLFGKPPALLLTLAMIPLFEMVMDCYWCGHGALSGLI
jgi:hypothetical protein